MNKVLSIIIPTYNMEDYLRQCLDSLIIADDLMQQLEVLVINDGSKDQSSAIAHEYSRKHPSTIFVIDKENGNYGSCINRGLKEATGKFIKILDADDSFDSAALAEFINQLRDTNADLVITNFSVVDSEGRTQQEVVIKAIADLKIASTEEVEELKTLNKILSEILSQLRGAATNLNQIARKMNTDGFMPREDILYYLNKNILKYRKESEKIWLLIRRLISGQIHMEQ